ncbi:hypothetical protein L7F22_022959 [Adiantum nelumboides]|nr:hypothetical protein [Adiantum nelumboides]
MAEARPPPPTKNGGETIPPLPDPMVHVVEVTNTSHKNEGVIEVNDMKRDRGKGKMHDEDQPESSKKKTKEERVKMRRINLQDFPLGRGLEPYNLIEDMQGKGPHISWPQFLAICPQMRKELARADLDSGRLICRNDNHKRIVSNMNEQRQEDIQVELTPSDTEEEFSTIASEEENSNITTEEDSSMEVMGIRLRPVNKGQASQVEEEVKEQPQESNEEMIEVIANGPFEKWGFDAMGPLPRTANGKIYILVAIDYMTRFGTPLEIVSDNGPGFRRGLLTEVCEELKISHRHSTSYYPQSNGLVEKANRIIASIIRKTVESKPKRWDNFLDGAIWAYRTTYRDATQFTPFHLVYGQEALQPIELNLPTIKLTWRQEQNNDEAWIDKLLSLVELKWKREATYHCYERKALQLKDKLNEGLKDKEIKEKSLVLRYNNALDNRVSSELDQICVKNTELQVQNEMLQQRLKPLEDLEKQVLAQEDVAISDVLMDEGDLNLLKKEKAICLEQLQDLKNQQFQKDVSPGSALKKLVDVFVQTLGVDEQT